MENSEHIWYKDISNFINNDNYNTFFPTQYMSFEEKLNSLYRLVIYTLVLSYLWTFNFKMSVSLIILAGLLSIFIYEIYIHNKLKNPVNVENLFQKPTEKFMDELNDDRKCIKPTENNPMSNVLIASYPDNLKPEDFPDKNEELSKYYEACSVSDPNIKKSMEEKLEHNLYRSIDDVFGRKASERQWVSLPNEPLLNSQKKFGEWLYGDVNKTNKTVEF